MATKVTDTRGKVPPRAQLAARSASNPPAGKPPTSNPLISNPLISDGKLKQIYSTMLQCRLLEERPRGAAKGSARPLGEGEGAAVVAGAAVDLRPGDWLAPFENEMLGRFLKVQSPESILSAPGKPAGRLSVQRAAALPSVQDSSSIHILPKALNPAAQLNLASGVALALQAKKEGSIVMVFFSDTSDPGPRWYEALNFAGRYCLPLLVVVQSRSSSRHPRTSFAEALSEGSNCEVPVIPVDAEDVVALYRVAYESIHKARHGGGPTLIQAVSLSSLGKAGNGAGKVKNAPGAIERMESYLAARGLFSASWKQELLEEFVRKAGPARGPRSSRRR